MECLDVPGDFDGITGGRFGLAPINVALLLSLSNNAVGLGITLSSRGLTPIIVVCRLPLSCFPLSGIGGAAPCRLDEDCGDRVVRFPGRGGGDGAPVESTLPLGRIVSKDSVETLPPLSLCIMMLSGRTSRLGLGPCFACTVLL